MKIRTLALLTGAATTAALLVGCASDSTNGTTPGMDHGTDSSSTPSAGVVFNDADVAFAMNMIVHHEQAIDMAGTLLAKDGVDERLTELAEKIQQAQGPEIDEMNAWLEAWGRSSDSGMEGMGHADMMSDDDMAALEAASGTDAGKLFLVQMTVHHEGAIDMAHDEVDSGENPDAVALASRIIEDQRAEIAIMQELLGTL